MCFWDFLSTYWINHRTGFKYFHILNFEGETPRVGWSKPMHFMHTFFEKSNRYDADRSWLRTADVDIFITCVNFESCGSWVLASQRIRYDRLSWLWLYTLRLWFFLWDAHGFKTNMLYLHLLEVFLMVFQTYISALQGQYYCLEIWMHLPNKDVCTKSGQESHPRCSAFVHSMYFYLYIYKYTYSVIFK